MEHSTGGEGDKNRNGNAMKETRIGDDFERGDLDQNGDGDEQGAEGEDK